VLAFIRIVTWSRLHGFRKKG